MSRRAVGLVLLNAAGVLVIAGALYDLFVPSVPANHLAYLGAAAGGLDRRCAELDLAMLRSIGGGLMAVGVTALILANGSVRRGEGWARVAGAVLVELAEGNNAYRMYPFASPWYGLLGFAVLAVTGAILAGLPRPVVAASGLVDPRRSAELSPGDHRHTAGRRVFGSHSRGALPSRLSYR